LNFLQKYFSNLFLVIATIWAATTILKGTTFLVTGAAGFAALAIKLTPKPAKV
jgi:hypothetical protein